MDMIEKALRQTFDMAGKALGFVTDLGLVNAETSTLNMTPEDVLYKTVRWYLEQSAKDDPDVDVLSLKIDGVVDSAVSDYQDEQDAVEDYSDDSNMPCDTYGPSACNRSCPRYWTCRSII